MIYRFLTLLTLFTTALATSESAKEKVLARVRSHSGRTLSIINGNPDFCFDTAELQKMLIKRKEVREKEEGEFIEAAKNGKDLTSFLQDEHLNINAKDADGKTALMYAAKYGYPSVVQALLVKEARAFMIKDNEGLCAFDHATGHHEIRKLMQEMQPMGMARRNSAKTPALVVHLSPDEKDKKDNEK